ncbi:hypothetical protein [Calothrix sp. 336/3]|uniref:hypothetical protein n=1 Tax=Calothrix sp. 336/3 TaxID=1337936 RepID=UPI0004E2AF3A|nr:hypothetical protein [Calothrix sp. 336/3]AKG23042.1 hypothetical protein IJ00_18800 [Calothrix sp. 336/3]
MNFLLPSFLKSFYRREPVIAILFTIGAIDTLIGGIDDSWSLVAFGLGTAGFSLAYRWWRVQQSRPLPQEEQVVQRYLPAQSSNSVLPMLSVSKKKPPL